MGAIQQVMASFGGSAGFELGFNFRATSGYVTDGADQIYVLSGDAYPTTRLGATFGWVVGAQPVLDANRNNAIDPRLAGINYVEGGAAITTYFRVDLPSAGTCEVRLALGDASFAQNNVLVIVKDTTTTLFQSPDITGLSSASGHFYDANGDDLTTVTWPGTNTPQSVEFATTQMRVYLGDPAAANVSTLAFIGVSKA